MIDSVEKRFSAIESFLFDYLSYPDGTADQATRQDIAGLYRGILATSSVAEITSNEFLLEYLLTQDALTALVGTRIYDGGIPQHQQKLPCINFYQISAPQLMCNAERERFQISCRDKTLDGVKNLAFLVRRALNNLQGYYNSFNVQMVYHDTTQFFQEEWGMYHAPVDVFIFYVRS